MDNIRGEADSWRRRHGPVAIGACGTMLLGTVTAVLLSTTLRSWPGLGLVAVEVALPAAMGVLATLVAAWATAVLAAATLQVASGSRTGERAAARPVRLVAAALIAVAGAGVPLSATAVSPAPHVAAAAPVPVPAHAPAAVTTIHDSAPGTTGATGASADTGSTPDHGHQTVPTPGWVPTGEARPSPTTPDSGSVDLVSSGGADRAPASQPVVVHRGDTLWDIAARHLGPGATDTDVAEEWPRWYAANRDLIGPDPDLILPGQELVVPAPAEGGGR